MVDHSDQLTPAEISDYGTEFLNVVAKQARQATAANTHQLQQGLAEVQQVLRRTALDQMKSRMDRELPEWRQINVDPNFLEWLKQRDAFSGRSKNDLLQEAWNTGAADRVIALFQTHRSEGGRQPRPDPYPGRQRGATHPSGKPWIRQSDIERFYRWVSEGKYEHKQAEKEEAERDLFQAMNEGRVIP